MIQVNVMNSFDLKFVNRLVVVITNINIGRGGPWFDLYRFFFIFLFGNKRLPIFFLIKQKVLLGKRMLL